MLFSLIVFIIAILAFPAQAADNVINLLDESGASWENKDANSNSISVNFTGGKMISTAPGAWPWVTATLNTPVVIKEADNAVLKLTFTVEDDSACTSIRLLSGSDAIYTHHFIEGGEYDDSGDIKAGTYDISMKVFDLQAFAGTADDKYLGKKALVLNDSNELVIDGFQVWCSGQSSDITVTISKFEIVIPDNESETSEESEESESSATESAEESSATVSSQTSDEPKTGDKGYTGLLVIVIVSAALSSAVLLKKRSRHSN
ncbi:MAG TPA: hypothetical protein DD733_05010 [Clostridiales bacterium]|nr:hypothetical protein [Clostridiales bacterium]